MLKFILFIFFVCLGEAVSSQSITKNTDMNFGNIAVNNSGGTVILDPSGSRTGTGGVTLPAIAGSVNAASFDISGTALLTYGITLPIAGCTLSSGGNTMSIDTFTSTPSTTGALNGIGTQILNVGATLHVGGTQTSGNYTSGGSFTVTVNYN